MSNSRGIAAVTETLRQLLESRINAAPADDPNTDIQLVGTSVTTQPPDKARSGVAANQVNLFLCHIAINPAWRNQDLPRQVRPGETGSPPLALNLTYLITAYGSDDESGSAILGHRLIGRAMSILHDCARLNRKDIQGALPGNDLYQQIDSITVTHQPLSMDEMISKLWVAFQTPYRISVAYLVSVVLIESSELTPAPLPVLKIGKDDRGPIILSAPPVVLDSIQGEWVLALQPPPASGPQTRRVLAPGGLPLARLGDSLIISAKNLPGGGFKLRVRGPALPAPLDFDPLPGSKPGDVRLDLPAADQVDANGTAARKTWSSGSYSLVVIGPDPSNPGSPAEPPQFIPLCKPVFFDLAPSLRINPLTALAGELLLAVECSPRIGKDQEQSVFLLFDSNPPLPPESIATPALDNQPTALTFRVTIPAGRKDPITVRLRVNGVDSLPFALDSATGSSAPIFDPKQQVQPL